MHRVFVIVAIATCSIGIANAAQSSRLVLPLPSHGKNISVLIGDGIKLVAVPNEGDWQVQAFETHPKGTAYDLLFPSLEWHGPTASDIAAWQVLKHYGFGNTRWICVRGHKLEVKLHILDAHVEPVSGGTVAMFTVGQLVIEWFHRPCTDHRNSSNWHLIIRPSGRLPAIRAD